MVTDRSKLTRKTTPAQRPKSARIHRHSRLMLDSHRRRDKTVEFRRRVAATRIELATVGRNLERAV